MKHCLAFALALLATAPHAFAEGDAPSATPRSAPEIRETTIAPVATARANTVEVAVLRARLEEEKAHNAAVLQTVYWSLGVLGTIAVALIGFGWLANFRIYERDKEALTGLLEGELNTGLADARRLIAEDLGKVREQSVQATGALRKEIAASVGHAVDEKANAAHEQLVQLSRVVAELRLDHEMTKAASLFRQGLHGNGFTAALTALSLARDMGRTWQAESILSDLEKQIEKMDWVYASDIRKLSTFLETPNDVSSIQRDRLVELLRRKPTK